MNPTHSKSAFLYTQVRRGLKSGRYLPGQRIDPATLAAEFNTSPTPVRFALYRLVGEGLLADHARGGLHVPLPNEVALHDLYDWMQRLLLMACDIRLSSTGRRAERLEVEAADGDVAGPTWKLFDAIARAAAHRSLHQAVKRANDQLAPVRRAKQALLERPVDEFEELNRQWRVGDIEALKAGLREYHERRKQLVPCIVSLLSEGSEQLH